MWPFEVRLVGIEQGGSRAGGANKRHPAQGTLHPPVFMLVLYPGYKFVSPTRRKSYKVPSVTVPLWGDINSASSHLKPKILTTFIQGNEGKGKGMIDVYNHHGS